jgi:thiamine-monophosphate kinase
LNTPGSEAVQLADVGERGLIERIRRRLPDPPESLIVGIGDDAAVVMPDRGALQVLTTDSLVEGIHFERRFCSLFDIGYKALAVNVSDIAAMGGTPRLALLSLILPSSLTVADVEAVIDGVSELARETRIAVAGGNITRSPGPLAIDVTLVGAVRPRKFLTRSAGRPGDDLYVTGTIGAGVAGLRWLIEHGDRPDVLPEESELVSCVTRYRRPAPRWRIGALLGRTRSAAACMDLSDGLADAVRQVAAASGTGARVVAEDMPVDPGARLWFDARGMDAVDAAVAGGDDYELLFSVPERNRRRLRAVESLARGLPLTRIGQLTREPEVVLIRNGRPGPLAEGFTHF